MVVVRGVPEHLGGQLSSGFQDGVSVLLDLFLDDRVISRIHHHRNGLVILGGTAQHARPADIDVLDGQFRSAVGLRNGLLKRVQVDHHEINRRNPMLVCLISMGLQVLPLQKPSVHLGMQGFYPAIHHLGKSRVVAQLHHVHPGIPERLGRTPGGNQLHPAAGQKLGKIHQPGLVGYRKQGPLNARTHPISRTLRSPFTIRPIS